MRHWSKQKILTAFIIFVTLCSIGFSYSGRQVHWFWVGAPYLAILLVAAAFAASRAWLRLDRQKQESKILAIINTQEKRPLEQIDDPRNNLSDREKEVLQKINEGKSNKEIADELFIELSTVKTHINKIYKTLKVSGRQEASRWSQKRP